MLSLPSHHSLSRHHGHGCHDCHDLHSYHGHSKIFILDINIEDLANMVIVVE